MIEMTIEEWKAEARRRFGDDPLNWKFVCPSCGYVACVKEWRDLGAEEGAVAFSCVGRFIDTADDKSTFSKDGGPCTYAGGGLIRLNPVIVDGDPIFAFADEKS